MNVQPITDQMTVIASDGLILLDDEAGCAVTLTPEAAIATSDALMRLAVQAIGQSKQTRSGGRAD